MEFPSFLFILCISFNAFAFGTSSKYHQTVPPCFCYFFKFSIHDGLLRDHALEGHVFKRSTVEAVTHCHVMWRGDCRCISMNYIHNKQEDNCELNDVNKQMKPAAMKCKFGADYYDLVREVTKKVINV